MSPLARIGWDIFTAVIAALILIGVLNLRMMSWRRQEQRKQREREEKYGPRRDSI